mgnify:CR=1 FL=1
MQLYTKILIGMVAGILVGTLYNLMYDKDQWERWNPDGDQVISWQEYAEVEFRGGRSETYDFIKQIAPAVQKEWEKIDANQNKSLSKEEFAAWESGPDMNLKEAAFIQLNTNRDYVVDLTEFVSGNLNIPLTEAEFQAADKNRDTVLTLAEFEKIKDPFLLQVSFASLSGGDQEISEEELGRMLAVVTDFNQMDRSGDGVVKMAEFKAVHGWQRFARYTDPIGDIFIRLVKMLVVPLVLISLILGAASLGDIRKVGKIGVKAFSFFFFTTAIAAMVGIGTGNLFRPGDGLPKEKTDELIAQYEERFPRTHSNP